MKYSKIIMLLSLVLFFSNCHKEQLFDEQVEDIFWIENAGAQMPVWIEGNTNSKKFMVIIHGGPGGESRTYNLASPFSDPIEAEVAVAYWDQRNAGASRGNTDESKLTVEQMVDDLDKVVDALSLRYGNDIEIYLMGHSWGGFLGTAYLLDSERQAKISGWIEIAGGHDFPLFAKEAAILMKQLAIDQIPTGKSVEFWEEVLTFTETINLQNISQELSNEINGYGKRVQNVLEFNDVIQSTPFLEKGEGFAYWFQSPYHPIANAVNQGQSNNIIVDQVWDVSLTPELNKITIPCLFLYGKYDAIVPPALGVSAFEKISTPIDDKKFILLEKSGHFLTHEPDVIVAEILEFVGE